MKKVESKPSAQELELQKKTEKLKKFLDENGIGLTVSGEFIDNQIVTRIGVSLKTKK